MIEVRKGAFDMTRARTKVRTRRQLIGRLRKHKEILKERFGMTNIGIYGDFAVDRADDCCYVEILADLDHDDFDKVIEASIYIGELTHRKVFIAHEMTAKAHILPIRREEKVPI